MGIARIRREVKSATNIFWEIDDYPTFAASIKEYDPFSLALSARRLPAFGSLVT